jgi:hypothetical protein
VASWGWGWGGEGLGAVAVMVGVDSASGGGSASTDLNAKLASRVKLHDVLRDDGIGRGGRNQRCIRLRHVEGGGTVTREHVT